MFIKHFKVYRHFNQSILQKLSNINSFYLTKQKLFSLTAEPTFYFTAAQENNEVKQLDSLWNKSETG